MWRNHADPVANGNFWEQIGGKRKNRDHAGILATITGRPPARHERSASVERNEAKQTLESIRLLIHYSTNCCHGGSTIPQKVEHPMFVSQERAASCQTRPSPKRTQTSQRTNKLVSNEFFLGWTIHDWQGSDEQESKSRNRTAVMSFPVTQPQRTNANYALTLVVVVLHPVGEWQRSNGVAWGLKEDGGAGLLIMVEPLGCCGFLLARL
uniref:Uncharacterized protein n=1 Tax=Entomoneis paludosa TaxID=265537 RepID=A0A7S2YSI6_9STRA|mmetsp:Transcript_8346/g.17368  ORF Transcript_8346/g.17368 Transcript_8346/m.17368 type:complete len:209 (+) Transcript_8346:421-1047(+)